MYGVFTISKDGTILISEEARSLCDVLNKLTQEQVRYIILAHDYHSSPYRLKPPEERKLLSKRKVWGDVEFDPEEYKNVKEGIDEYRGLIYDQNRENRDVLLTKTNLLNAELISEIIPRQISNIISSINIIEEKLEGIEQKIDRDEQAILLKGSKEQSMIEKYMQNKESYQRRMKDVIGKN